MLGLTMEAISGAAGLVAKGDAGLAAAINTTTKLVENVETEAKIIAYAAGAKVVGSFISGLGVDVPFIDETMELAIGELINQCADTAMLGAGASVGIKAVGSFRNEYNALTEQQEIIVVK